MENVKQIQVGGHNNGQKYVRPIVFALVDEEDFLRLNKYKWSSLGNNSRGYYATRWQKPDRKKHILMHHQIIGTPPKGMIIDHINGNTLDNRRQNLRFVTYSQNMMNRKTNKNSSTGYKGVMLAKRDNVYKVYISANKKRLYLGSFPKTKKGLQEAVKIYQEKSKKLHKEYARK